MKPITLLLLICAAIAGLSGCATKDDKTADNKKKDDYVWITPTGSNIPVRVKKTEVQDDKQSQGDQAALRDIQKRGAVEHRGD